MIYEHGLLITVDAERRIIGDGAMVVRDGRFAAIDKTATLRERFPLEQRIDLKGKVVTPGLVNTHVHLAQAMIRGCADDMELLEWLGKRVWVLQGNYTEEDGRASAELCILEMLKSGTTAFVESLLAERYGFSGIAEVVLRSGIRAALAKIVMDVGTYATKTGWMHPGMVEDRDTSLKNTLAMYDQWNGAGNGRLAVWFGPRTPGGVTPELYRQITALAHERNMGVTVHLAEVASDRKFLQETYGLSPARYAESVGLVGPRVLLVHAVWMDAADIEILARTRTNIAHNPASNAKLASGIAPIPEMLAAGVNVTLGTDGGPSDNTYDMVRDMRLASYLHKARTLNPLVTPAESVLEMATINGARALGWENEIGSLEVGKQADFVVFDFDQPHLTPNINPVSTLVCAATGSDVDTVVIAGQTVVEHGHCLTLDEERIVHEARTRAADLWKRSGIPNQPVWPLV
ncbi:MAG: Atrazine chlorohydrolase [Chloroflexi bacterium ADurb.Bin180]|nr:MAG: Atrazine chlorohydrolase [Chloroflexi bacterium ADurb.Bin180]